MPGPRERAPSPSRASPPTLGAPLGTRPKAFRRLAAGLLAFGFLVTPLALAQDPEAAEEWVDGELRFTRPADAHARVNLADSWRMQWAPTLTGNSEFSSFDFGGRSLRYNYVVTAVGAYALSTPAATEGELVAPESGVGNLYDFTTELVMASGGHEVVASGTGAPTDEATSLTDWKLSTVAPGATNLQPSPTGGMDSLYGRQVLLESKDGHLKAQNLTALRFYGYTVTFHHREGITQFRTGAWDEAVDVPGPDSRAAAFRYAHKEGQLTIYPASSLLEAESGDRPVRIVAPALALAGIVDGKELSGNLTRTHDEILFSEQDVHLEGRFLFEATQHEGSATPHRLHVTGLMADYQIGDQADDAVAAPGFPLPAAAAVAAGAGLLTLLLVAWWRGWLLAPVAALFARLTKGDMDRSEVRQRLLDVIMRDPGIAMREAAGKTGCGWGTVVYHVSVLQKLGYIEVKRVGLRQCLFENHGRYGRVEKLARGLIRQSSVHQLLLALDTQQGITQQGLAERSGLSQPQVSRLLTQLREAGLIEGGGHAGPARLTDLSRGLLREAVAVGG